jgi:hypothetical protein
VAVIRARTPSSAPSERGETIRTSGVTAKRSGSTRADDRGTSRPAARCAAGRLPAASSRAMTSGRSSRRRN